MTTATLPPRAHGLPVLGSIVELRRSQITAYEQARRDQGDVVRFAVGPPGLRFDLYGVFHPDGVRQVLAGSRDGYAKGGRFYQKIGESFGWGLLTSEGEEWLRQRRMIQPLFTRRTVATYGDLMTHEAVGLAERWSAAGTADANADAVRLSLRIVGATIFGGDVDGAHEVLARAFPTLNAWMFRRAMSPVATPAGWPTPGNREAGRARRALYGYVDSLVARRERTGATGDDLLSRLLRARDPDSGRGLAAQEVRDQALIFLLAGHETTSTALTFTFDLLGRHPEEQDALHAELDVVLKRPGAPRRRRPPADPDRDGDQGGDAALPPGVRRGPTGRARRRDRRVPDPRRVLPHALALGHPPAPGVLARPRPLPPLPVRRRDRGAAASPRLLPLRRRGSRMHRLALRDAGDGDHGRGGAAARAPGQRSGARGSGHPRHHPAARRPGAGAARSPGGGLRSTVDRVTPSPAPSWAPAHTRILPPTPVRARDECGGRFTCQPVLPVRRV